MLLQEVKLFFRPYVSVQEKKAVVRAVVFFVEIPEVLVTE